MTDFIAFGLNAVGFLVASLICYILISFAWVFVSTAFDWLADWAEKNGWN